MDTDTGNWKPLPPGHLSSLPGLEFCDPERMVFSSFFIFLPPFWSVPIPGSFEMSCAFFGLESGVPVLSVNSCLVVPVLF